MSTKRLLAFGILFLLLLATTSCTTWYYKIFALSATPPDFQNGFSFREFSCGFGIDAKPNETSSLDDSSYTIWTCVSVNDSINCNEAWDSVIGTMEIVELNLKYDKSTIILRFLSEDGRYSCNKCWNFESITISEAIDTLVLDLHLTYFQDGSQDVVDTSVELYRFQGKQKHFISY